MTKRKIKSYILRWQRLLRLEQWDIRLEAVDTRDLSGGAGDTDNVAQISMPGSIMEATIKLAIKRSDEEIAASIRHELLHLALNDFGATARRIADRLGAEAKELCYAEGAEIDEQTVIRLERMVNELLKEQKPDGN